MLNNGQWSEELEKLNAIINKVDMQKTVKWGADVYTFNGNNVLSFGGFKNFFSLWFFNGVFLKDKYKVLVNASEGKTKSLRQWRFTNINEIDENKILEYIYEAIEIEKKNLKITPKKFEALPIPNLLKEIFEKNQKLKTAFRLITPGKQNEYINFIVEAKQETTKIKRIEKIIPLIMDGKGLNDKYK
ncbi:MAG TPA: YdeI/OmpD-associated family protein [Bacteroidia bacterium]|nr:YdeI/OmpD-associated family protein [Bacteroidia bacterium]